MKFKSNFIIKSSPSSDYEKQIIQNVSFSYEKQVLDDCLLGCCAV
jgi:hypothetical protein